MITVGLIGHSSNSDNLGVGALTASQVAILRQIASKLGTELRIMILDWVQTRPPYIVGPDITVREMTGKTLASPSGYFSYVRQCDVIIDIGAGDSFADIYGPKRLTRMFWMKYLAHIARKPFVLAPQTYGPFTKPLSIRLTRGNLKWAALVASRDAKSTKAASEICPQADVIEASDVALRLPYDPPTAKLDGAKTDAPPKVGLNISGLLMNGGYTGKNMFDLTLDYPAMIRTLVQRLLDHPEKPELHLVAHVIPPERGNVEDDLQPALDLAQEFPQIKVAPAFADPSEAKTYIAGLDFFAGARMHACIAAFSSGVPVVPMAYSRKFEGLFGTLGYTRTVDCTAETGEAIIDKVVLGFEDRATLTAEMAPALAQGLEKLERYEQALQAVIAANIKR